MTGRRGFLLGLLGVLGLNAAPATWQRQIEDGGRRLLVTVTAGRESNTYQVWVDGAPMTADELMRAERMAREALTAWLRRRGPVPAGQGR